MLKCSQTSRFFAVVSALGLCSSAIFTPLLPAGQTIPQITLSGTVIELATDKPVAGVDIFLSNTTLAAVSDDSGHYVISNVPLSIYVLVASKQGYRLQTVNLHLTEARDQVVDFHLKPSEAKQTATDIGPSRSKEWKENYKRFCWNFLGMSKLASKCKILNPESLHFQFNSGTEELKAHASEPLQIENPELGYRITYYLQDFNATGIVSASFQGFARFEPMQPRKKKDLKKWLKKRKQAYQGSMRHFLTSLTRGTTKKEGFLMFNVQSLTQNPNELYLKEVHEEDLLSAGEFPFEKKLAFQDYLKVVYKYESESKEFSYYAERNPSASLVDDRIVRHEGMRFDQQTSALYLSMPSVTINTLGRIYNPFALTAFGYWPWENKIANQLPYDYEPEK